MRRLFILPLVLLGFASAVALGGTNSGTTTAKASAVGTIKSLGSRAITIHSLVDLTCKLTTRSPQLDGYRLGERVKIACANGRLVKIASVKKRISTESIAKGDSSTTALVAEGTASTNGKLTALGAGSITVTGDRSLTCSINASSPSSGDFHIGDAVKIGCLNGALYYITKATTAVSGTTAGGVGKLTALSADSITVTGDRALTCTIGASSPRTGDFHVGDAVKIGCLNGALYSIAKTTTGSTPTTTTSQPSTTAGGSGTLTGLTAGSLTVTGDRALTCSIGTTSPSTGDFHVGDAVKIGCLNGALYSIVKATAPVSSTTTTATTTPASTAASNKYGIGTISSLSATTISVTGDSPLSCELTSSSPRLGDYRVGDHVKIACQNFVLVGVARADGTTATTTAATTTTTASSQNTYGIGTITALSSTSVTVTGDRTATCTLSASGPSPADYHLGVGSHVTIACENGVVTHISTA